MWRAAGLSLRLWDYWLSSSWPISCRTKGRISGSGRNGPSHFPIRKVEAFWACIRSVLGIVNWPSWANGTSGRSASLKTKVADLSKFLREAKVWLLPVRSQIVKPLLILGRLLFRLGYVSDSLRELCSDWILVPSQF